jgi:hypothetical protein
VTLTGQHEPEASASEDTLLTNQTPTAPISQSGPSVPVVPIGDLIGFGDGDNWATAGSTSALASSSTGTATAASHQTVEGSSSPILPLVLVTFSGFRDVFDLLSPGDNSDILANPIAVPTIQTSWLPDRPEPQNPHTETVVSPTRTLFPLIPHPNPTTERGTAPEGHVNMTHARMALLRYRNQELEAENEVLSKENTELRKKCEDLEKMLAGFSALGL